MRPSPAEVLAWFECDLDQQALDTTLRVLETDPNWAVFTRRVPHELEVELHYTPVGVRLFVRLEQVAAEGRLVWRGGL